MKTETLQARQLPRKVRRLAVESLARDLDQLDGPVRGAVVSILDSLADLPRDRAVVCLAMAKLATMEPTEALRTAEWILAKR